MKYNDEEKDMISNYIGEYIEDVESTVTKAHEFIHCFTMDEDNELAIIEAAFDILRCKIKSIKKPKDISDLKDNIKFKKIAEDAIEEGGVYERERRY